MWLDRQLIKNQAKSIIKGKWPKLFGISLSAYIVHIIMLLMLFGIFFGSMVAYMSYYDDTAENGYSGEYEQYFNENYGSGSSEAERNFRNFGSTEDSEDTTLSPRDPFESFDGTGHIVLSIAFFSFASVITALFYALVIASVLTLPLSVALPYYFVELVNGRYNGFRAGVRSVYHNAFKVKYGKKLGGSLLKDVIIWLLSYLFYIPAFIFYYSSYFSFEIMSEYPELSPWEAIKLSRKMVRGYRTELFVLELSFIPWALLCVLVIPCVYVGPYMRTVKALYYENFKRRALAHGVITPDDFLSDRQKLEKMMNGGYGNYYQPPYGAYAQQPQGSYSRQAQGTYSQQTQDSAYQQPQGAYYQQPHGVYEQPPAGGQYPPPPGNMHSVYYESVMKSVFFEPVIQTKQAENDRQDSASVGAEPPKKPYQEVEFTVSEAQEPVKPDFAEPEEPKSEMTEPVEQTEPADAAETDSEAPVENDLNG